MPATGSFNGEAFAIGYSIDSRTIQPGELFFAVKGERLDGHDFVEAALQAEPWLRSYAATQAHASAIR